MSLRKVLLIVVFTLAAAVCLRPAAAPQEVGSRCVVYIPSQWGKFQAASQGYGLVFQDDAGALRFVVQMPCGLEGTPNVSLEVRRR